MALLYKPHIVNDKEGCLLLNTLWKKEKPGHSKFLQYDKYLLVKVPNEAVNYISIKMMEEQKTSFEEIVSDLHPELKALFDRFKQNGLTLQEIKRLKNKIEKLEKTLLPPEKIPEILEEIASKILETKLKKKVFQNFEKAFENFFACLNSDLINLEPDKKTETVRSLKSLRIVSSIVR
ncbi:MAG: hypothetical protein GX892_12140, partial [Thermoanaerobacteraceae bacterium]|nr:hypothetical protein [Thermoanaerobacteraceae bacterium]